MANNYGIKVNLQKLQNAFLKDIKGKTTTKRCIIIPVDDNPNMYVGEKGCYLNLTAFETTNNQFGDSHLIKADIPKEIRDTWSQEQKDAQPILGNMRPFQGQQVGSADASQMFSENEDDVPF